MRRSQRLGLRQANAAATKTVNRRFKTKERKRRDARMIEAIKKKSPPFTPEVQSWLSAKLHKRSSCITDADIKALLSANAVR